MKIVTSEAGRLFFTMLALILAATLTTPSNLTSSDGVLVHRRAASTDTAKNSAHKNKKEKWLKNKRVNKTLADLF
jgi:hypothetical protein